MRLRLPTRPGSGWSGRIDYIFTKNIAGISYENVLDIDRSSRLRSTPASDHNTVLAKVKLK